MFANLSWLAVIAGFVLSFLLGWLWYSPKLFGEKWAEGVGVELADGASMPVGAMVCQALGTFFLSLMVGVLWPGGAIVLLTVVIVLLLAGAGLFVRKSTYAILTETGFVVAMVVIMSLMQGLLG